MTTMSVIEYCCNAHIFSKDRQIGEKLESQLFPRQLADVTLSYGHECNCLDIQIESDDEENPISISLSIPPEMLIVKLLSLFVEYNDRPLREKESEK